MKSWVERKEDDRAPLYDEERQGIGSILVDALQVREFPTAQGSVLFIAVINVFVNLLVDLLYGFIDPRISTVSSGSG